MTGRERIREAMELGEGDRVPLMCQLSIGHYFLQSGLDPVSIWCESEVFAEALVRLQEKYYFDGILVNLPGRDPKWKNHVERIADVEGERVIFWRSGDRTVFPPDDNPRGLVQSRAAVTLEDLDPEKLFYAEPWGLLPIPVSYTWDLGEGPDSGTEMFPPYQMDAIKAVREKAGPSVSVHGEVFSPWSQFLELLGFQNALMAIMDDPGKVMACLERFAEGAVTLARLQSALDIDAILISSAFAGGGFISREHYLRFVEPFEAKVIRGIREVSSLPVYTHTCGAIGDRLDLMLRTGTQGIDTLDPPPLGTVDLAVAKSQLGGRAFIKGNIDPVNTLLNGTAQQVRDDAIARLRIGRPGGGYILSSACSVAPRTPAENLEVLIEAIEISGYYNHRGSLR